MKWKRGLFRVYLVLAVLWVAGAGWELYLNPPRRDMLGLVSDPDLAKFSDADKRDVLVRAGIKKEACIQAVLEGRLSHGFIPDECSDDFFGVNRVSHRALAWAFGKILLLPVIVWWFLRGIVAVGAWIVRGFGRS